MGPSLKEIGLQLAQLLAEIHDIAERLMRFHVTALEVLRELLRLLPTPVRAK